MNRNGFDSGMLVQIILWSVIIIIVFLLIRHYIVGSAAVVPGENLIPGT